MSIQRTVPNPDGRIAATIVDYDTPELAARCVESLADCDLFCSVSLVDAKQLGWSYAMSVNTALAIGGGDIVLALNADTRMLEPPTVILDLFDHDPQVGIVGPRQVDDHARVRHGGIFGPNEQPFFRCFGARLTDVDPMTSDTVDATTVSGSVFFARRSCWAQVGGFLPVPRMYYEETFACLKARHLGWRVLYTGATTWEHLWNSTPVDGKAQMAAESLEVFRAACAAEGIPCE